MPILEELKGLLPKTFDAHGKALKDAPDIIAVGVQECKYSKKHAPDDLTLEEFHRESLTILEHELAEIDKKDAGGSDATTLMKKRSSF